jgi:hypothetical protein
MLNRDLLVVRLKQPFVDWVNEADPYPDGSRLTLGEVNEDVSTYLIHDSASEDLDGWLEECYLHLFEAILEEWYVDEALWPQDRSLALFRRWCDVEIHSMVFDLVDGPLVDDEFELSDRLLHEDG